MRVPFFLARISLITRLFFFARKFRHLNYSRETILRSRIKPSEEANQGAHIKIPHQVAICILVGVGIAIGIDLDYSA